MSTIIRGGSITIDTDGSTPAPSPSGGGTSLSWTKLLDGVSGTTYSYARSNFSQFNDVLLVVAVNANDTAKISNIFAASEIGNSDVFLGAEWNGSNGNEQFLLSIATSTIKLRRYVNSQEETQDTRNFRIYVR